MVQVYIYRGSPLLVVKTAEPSVRDMRPRCTLKIHSWAINDSNKSHRVPCSDLVVVWSCLPVKFNDKIQRYGFFVSRGKHCRRQLSGLKEDDSGGQTEFSEPGKFNSRGPTVGRGSSWVSWASSKHKRQHLTRASPNNPINNIFWNELHPPTQELLLSRTWELQNNLSTLAGNWISS